MQWRSLVVGAPSCGRVPDRRWRRRRRRLDVMNSGRRTMTAERMRDDERIVLDGILDEPAWGRAQHGGEFIMQDPVLGGAPTERTEVRVVFNHDHLYIGATMYDSEPDKLKGNTSKRDEFLSADDRFMWTMDTFLNQQTGYFFEMNPSGLMADALKGPTGTNAREWDGIWNARARQSEIGWVLEIDIPFRSLTFDPNAPAWGINFQRTVRRKQEELLWTGHQRNQGLQRMANAGLLVGIKDVSPGRGFELRPYVSGHAADAPRRRRRRRGSDTSADVGIDMAYNLTPSLRGVATINTDFAETEVDQRLVNLTRFPLFLPERRTFFLDGATFFDLPFNAVLLAAHRAVDGQPQPIIGGGKLNGQAGKNDIGALYVRTAEEQDGSPARAFWSRDGGGACCSSRTSARFYTGRDTHDTGRACRRGTPPAPTSGSPPRRSWATRTWRPPATGSALPNSDAGDGTLSDSAAFSGKVGVPERHLGSHRRVPGSAGALYNPAVGFTPRREYRLYNPELIWSPRPKTRHRFIRRFRFGLDPEVYTDLQNRKQSIDLDLQPFRIELHSGDNAEVGISPSYERLDEPFEIAPGVILPGGTDYEFMRYRVGLNTANQRVVALHPEVEWGSFFSGDRTELHPRRRRAAAAGRAHQHQLRVQPRVAAGGPLRHTPAAGGHRHAVQPVHVPGQQHPVPTRSAVVLGWQARYRWIVRPGNDVFFVYTHNWVEDQFDPNARFSTLDRRGAAKVVYTKTILNSGWRLG